MSFCCSKNVDSIFVSFLFHISSEDIKLNGLCLRINIHQFFLTAKMNAGLILRSVYQTIDSMVPKILTIPTTQSVLTRKIHYMCNREKLSSLSNLSSHNTCFLLQPELPVYNSVCGLKMKGRLQLRCKDCYYLCKNERWYVMCKTHPKHKQVQFKKREYKTWIITWASQSKIRGW